MEKYKIFITRHIHSFFSLDANSCKLIVGIWPVFILLNAFSALEETF